jgi:hypothetical protein
MSLYKQFETSTALETGGKWFEINPPNEEDGTKPGFLLARRSSKNAPFAARMEKVLREHKRDLDNGSLPVEESRRLLVESFVDTVLKDWRNVRDKTGMVMDFNKTNAMKLFGDLPDLFDVLQEQSGLITNYQDKLIAAAGKK